MSSAKVTHTTPIRSSAAASDGFPSRDGSKVPFSTVTSKIRSSIDPSSENPGKAGLRSCTSAAGKEPGDEAEEDAEDEGLSNGLTSSAASNARADELNFTPLTVDNLSQAQQTQVQQEWAGVDDGANFNEATLESNMFDTKDDISDVSSDSNSDGTAEQDLEAIVDDDDYDGVDNVSETSDQSAAFEAAVEDEIFAAGESAIDWDNVNTYNYDDSWEANQYSLSIDFGEPSTPLEHDLYQRRRHTVAQARPSHDISHLSTFLRGTPLDEDWPSSSSESDQGSQNGEESSKSQTEATGDGKIAKAEESESEFDDETDEEELPIQTTVRSPAVTLTRPNSRLETRSPSVRASIETPGRKPGKYAIMRKFPINPMKASAFSTPDPKSPHQRMLHFTAPKKCNLRWVSARASRSRSMSGVQTPTLGNNGGPATDNIIHGVINGRLFRQFNCATPDVNTVSSPSAEFARSAFLRSSFRPFNWTGSIPGGEFLGLSDNFDISDDAHNDLIDLSGGTDDGDESQDTSMQVETPMPPPPRPSDSNTSRTTSFASTLDSNADYNQDTPVASALPDAAPSSPLAHVSRGARKGNFELGAPFEPKLGTEPRTPDSDQFLAARQAQSSSPRKRQVSTGAEESTATTLTPALKKQRM